MFDWDYFEIRPVLQAAWPRSWRQFLLPDFNVSGLLRQVFRERSDGNWDYFPRGFGQPGYRVDLAMRERISNALHGHGRPTRWVFIPFIALLVLFKEREDITLIAFGVFLALAVALGLLTRQKLRAILYESPERIKELSSAERRRRNIELWRYAPPSSHREEFLLRFGFLALWGLLFWTSFVLSFTVLRWLYWASVPLVACVIFDLARLAELAISASRWAHSVPANRPPDS